MKVRAPKSRFNLDIKKSDKVLEVGGGHNPHPRSNVVVDKYTETNYHRSGNIFVNKHQKFIEKHELPFRLLADVDKKVINAYGVWGPKKFMGREYDGIHRTSFVIDEKGVIEDVITKVKTKDHAAQIL